MRISLLLLTPLLIAAAPAAERAGNLVAARPDPRRRRHGGPRGRQRRPSPRLRLCRRALRGIWARAGGRGRDLLPGGAARGAALHRRFPCRAGRGRRARRSPSPATSSSEYPAGRRRRRSTRLWSFIGYGLHLPEAGHNDFAGHDLRGKIAVVIQGAGPAELSGALKSHARADRSRLLLERGAVGVILLDPLGASEQPWATYSRIGDAPGMYPADAGGAHARDRPS